jgi:hypothetical protein
VTTDILENFANMSKNPNLNQNRFSIVSARLVLPEIIAKPKSLNRLNLQPDHQLNP